MGQSGTAAETPGADRQPRSGGRSHRVLHIGGVAVRADVSILILLGLAGWVFYQRFSLLLEPGAGALVLLAAALGAVGVVGSVLVHELGHAFVSLARDVPVRGITLFALGGVTESTREARSARDEFAIVGVGPFASLVLAALLGLAYVPFQSSALVGGLLGLLAWTNLLLAAFNLVPGYPLDGGRLLRSLLWMASGRPHAATRWAARVGQVFAAALIGLGALGLLGLYGRFGLWEALIGFFLLRGATASHRAAAWQERREGRTALDLAGTVPPVVPGDLPLSEAVELVQQRPSLLWPVGEPLQGAVTLRRFDAVPTERWSSVPVSAIAAPLRDVTVAHDAPAPDVVQALRDGPERMLLVTRDGRAVGLLTPSLIAEDADG